MKNAPLAVSRLLTVVFDSGGLSLSLAEVDDRARTAGDAVAAVDVVNEEAHGDRCGNDSVGHFVNRVLWMWWFKRKIYLGGILYSTRLYMFSKCGRGYLVQSGVLIGRRRSVTVISL